MANLHTYEGEFKDNVPGGRGKLTIPGECHYEGQITYTGGKFKITGKIVNADGSVREGSFNGTDS